MTFPPIIDQLPKDEDIDFPTAGPLVPILDGPLQLPAIIFGAGTFAGQYNSDDYLASTIPLRSVRLALRYGIRAIDTSPYYGPSEIVLGHALAALRQEFPRSSYKLITKCGRYGTSNFDYSPTTIRESIKRSLQRLQTDYLDTVYLHDVEFVATVVSPKQTGNPTTALKDEAAAYGLASADEAKIQGEGDKKILNAFRELQKLKEEGLVKNIGITGYPLPTLLRLAILILHTPPYKPLDVLLSYSHLCLQNSSLLEFIPHFYERAKVRQIVAASPLSMGLLTANPPAWHPAPPELHEAVRESSKAWKGDYPNLAVGYSIRRAGSTERPLPLVVGFSNPREVHECIQALREVQSDSGPSERQEGEVKARQVFQDAGYLDWSWASPGN